MKKPLLALVLAAALPLPLGAQTRTTLSSYLASDGGVLGSPLLVGATVAREAGWAAMRAGGGASLGRGTHNDAGAELAVYAAEADGIVYLGSTSGDAAILPYAVVGAGLRVLSGASAGSTSASWSYGLGARTPVAEWLQLESEARYRQPIVTGVIAVPTEISAGWEFRFGVNVKLSGGTARRIPVSAPSRMPRAASAPIASSSAAAARLRVAERALDTADDFVGVRYTWGGNTPEEGFDCSGFIRYVYARHGIDLPRVSRDQARAGRALPLEVSALEPGDLVAFASRNGVIDHIAIYAGNGRIIHSSSSGNGVRFDDLHSSRGRWYLDHMVAATRVIQGGSELNWSAR